MATADQLILRPVRPADRERVVELTRDIWEGRDYIPRVFDEWVGEAGAAFQAVEVDGTVVGLQRLRPYAPGLIWYEGLRVANTHRRQGLATAMLRSAIAEARDQGFREMRLGTGDSLTVPLFAAAGFQRLVDVRWWMGPRVEGGESARIPDASEADKIWSAVERSPGFELYHGVTADFHGARDLDAAELARLASSGMLRAGPSGRAIACMRESRSNNIAVSVLAGHGGALRDLLLALRFEADIDNAEHVTIALPREHPAAGDLSASGYDFANDDDASGIWRLIL